MSCVFCIASRRSSSGAHLLKANVASRIAYDLPRPWVYGVTLLIGFAVILQCLHVYGLLFVVVTISYELLLVMLMLRNCLRPPAAMGRIQ